MLQFQALTKAHDRKDFDCGIPSLNQYLQRSARQDQDQDMGRNVAGWHGHQKRSSVSTAFSPGMIQSDARAYPARGSGRFLVCVMILNRPVLRS